MSYLEVWLSVLRMLGSREYAQSASEALRSILKHYRQCGENHLPLERRCQEEERKEARTGSVQLDGRA